MLKELDESAAMILNFIVIHLISTAIYISMIVVMIFIIGLSPPTQGFDYDSVKYRQSFSIPKYKDIFDIAKKFWSDINP